MNRTLSIALAGALLAVACDDAAAPSGTAGSVTVTAYVDRDASGSLTEGDLPLQGFAVQLQREGEVIASATTGADGRATFTGVEPGGYRVVPVGPAPGGAALTTSPSPTAVVTFQGSAPAVEFRYAFFPGRISGRVYRNDGGTEAYESGVDTPGAGVTVLLRADDAGQPGATLATTTADEEGAYEFAGLAPGTYFIEFEQLGAMNYGAEGRIFQVEVVPQAVATRNALFTGSIFMTVAEARAAAVNTTVAVVGTITVPAGVFTSGTGGVNSEIWVQDATGGIAVFSVPTADTAQYPLHRVLEVVGTKGLFNGKEQIGSPTTRSRGAGTPVVPLALTGTQANSLADEGELVRLANTRVDSLGTGTTSFDVWTTAPDGQVVNVRVASGTGFARADFTPGTRYSVTGVLSEFRGRAQIQPRFDTDVVEAGAPVARVIINEFMANPNAVFDNAGEYIELHNWGDAPQDLLGWTIRDNFGVDTIDVSLVIPAGGYLLFALNADPAVNGGLTVDFVYKSDIALGNSGDRIVLKDPAGVTVDSIAYTSGASAVAGAAVGVIDPSADNTVATLGTAGVNWSAQTSTYGGGPDRGTPRTQNDGYVLPTSPNRVPLPASPVQLSRGLLAPPRASSTTGGARR